MSNTAKILYSGFYDTPLAFVVQHKERQFLFWRVFDDDLDDYPDIYHVYSLPHLSAEEITRSWQCLPELAVRHLGEVPVKDVIFDPTRRREIETAVLDALVASSEAVPA